MKRRLITLVKSSNKLYNFYFWVGSILINFIKLFITSKDNLILFSSFGGRKFDDSPRAIYEEMLKDNRFNNFELVWAFNNPGDFNIPRGKKIKTDTLRYFITALRARCWVTNSTIERGLNFKGKKNFYFNTWHGTPIKKMGSDLSVESKSFSGKNNMNIDIMTSQSKFEADIFSRVFKIEKEKFVICGLPRNDNLRNATLMIKKEMMEKIGIPKNKKVILYAPTYREYERNEQRECIITPPIDFESWKRKIGEDYVILLRAHYEVAQVIDLKANNGFVYNVSNYASLNDLMLASDMLISDYSSIFYDYSILNKPMICYTYDYEEYSDKRGMYFDIRDYLVGGSITENDLIELIRNLPYEETINKVREFREKYVESYGNATCTSLNIIYENIGKN